MTSSSSFAPDLALPEDLCPGSEIAIDASLLSCRSIGEDLSLPYGVDELNRGFRDLTVDQSFADNTIIDHSFADNTMLDNTLADNTLLDNTIVNNTSITDSTDVPFVNDTTLESLGAFTSKADDTFHGIEDRERTTTTLTDVSQLSALSSIPSAAESSSSGSEDSAPEVDNQETFL